MHNKTEGYNLQTINPELSKEWNYVKNAPLRPEDVMPKSNRKVWWICNKGHEWEAYISNRTGQNKTGCPYCAGRRVLPDYNFAVMFPKLLDEWNYEKNENLTPHDLLPYSHKKVWWKCEKGHEWKTGIAYRTKQESGCPYCSGRLACSDNSLHALFPEIAHEWHPKKNGSLTPKDITSGTDKKVWWICEKGHEWRAAVCNRTGKQSTGCPYCSGKLAIDDNSLSALFPGLLKEWHYKKNGILRPDQLRPGSNIKVWWKCERGHEWKTSINHRTGKKPTSCPYCTNHTSRLEIRIYCELLFIFNDAKWRYKFNGTEIDIFIPKYSFGIEVDGYPWHLNKGKKDQLKTSTLSKHGIKIFRVRDEKLSKISKFDIYFTANEDDLLIIFRLFSNLTNYIYFNSEDQEKISHYLRTNSFQNEKEYNKFLSYLPSPPPEYSLAYLHSNLIPEWNSKRNFPLKPKNFTPGSGFKVWWICSNNHEWEASIASRAKGTGCPYCFGIKVSEDNCLAFLFPKIAKEWHAEKNYPATPDNVYGRTTKKYWWVCEKGHEWKASVGNRAKGNGCPYCSGRLVCDDNCLQTRFPELSKEWHPTKNIDLSPEQVIAGSHKKVWWVCKHGHEWKATIYNRTGRQESGCPFCAGQKVSVKNSLATVYPKLSKEWSYEKNAPLQPEDVMPKSNRKVWWKCDKGHEWKASINNRTGRYKTGCPYCSGRYATPENNLAFLFPDLIKEWHYKKNGKLKPDQLKPQSNKKVWWKCDKGHEWETSVNHRTGRGTGCPFCAGQKVSFENCLATLFPDVAKTWHYDKNFPLTPETITSKSGRKVWWICEKSHEWRTAVSNRTNGTGCPYCKGQKNISRKKSIRKAHNKPMENLQENTDALPVSTLQHYTKKEF